MSNMQDQYWQAVLDRNKDYDNVFFYGVMTSSVFCRPSCPARVPLRKNVRFYKTREAAQADGLRACKRCRPDIDHDATADLMHAMCRYIEKNNQKRLPLNHLAEQAGMSASHFQRCFKKAIGVSPKQYQDTCKLNRFKSHLKQGNNVTEAFQEAGYESSSRIYEKLDTHMGMTPGSYRKGGAGELISYAAAETPLGNAMIGATDRGICFLQFGDDKESLLEQLQQEYPKANITPMPKVALQIFNQWMKVLNDFLRDSTVQLNLPLDIRGTAFQRMVWEYLTTIPPGELKSYTEVAEGIGKPTSVRAVASACARNKIAIAIPCHRVIRGDGSLAGYKWGVARKRTLIDLERKNRSVNG